MTPACTHTPGPGTEAKGKVLFMPRYRLKVFIICIIVCFAAAEASAAPVTFNTALPVARGEGVFRLQSIYSRSTGDPTAQDRELTVLSVPLVLVYGATGKLALFAIIPYLDKELELTGSSGRVTRGDAGLGDAAFIARYTIWKMDRPGQTLRIAPFAAVKAPTGEDGAADALGDLPRTLQLGSGSWDFTPGTIVTWQTLAWQLDGSASYRFNGEAKGFRFGDEARLDLSFQYRLLPRSLGPGLPAFLYAVLESGLVWKDRNEAGGADDGDSGGTTWSLTPAVQYVTRRVVVEAALQVPVLQELNGGALEKDFTGVLSLRVNF